MNSMQKVATLVIRLGGLMCLAIALMGFAWYLILIPTGNIKEATDARL